jgi:hypothetical protein
MESISSTKIFSEDVIRPALPERTDEFHQFEKNFFCRMVSAASVALWKRQKSDAAPTYADCNNS